MSRKLIANNYLIAGNIENVITNKIKRAQYTFTYKSKRVNYYLVEGKMLTVKEFNLLFPIDVLPKYTKGLNSDRSHAWINGEKSY